jgi:DNA-binding NarL/FixJ family response regulator
VHLAGFDETPSFAFVVKPLGGAVRPGDAQQRLRRHLETLAQEVQIAAAAVPVASAPTVVELPELARLTHREWEVVTRLLHGKRVPTIAKELGLSASTVRNHLSATFTKLGVRSQAELLERVRRPAAGAPAPRSPR